MHAKTALVTLTGSTALVAALVFLLPEPHVAESVTGRTTVTPSSHPAASRPRAAIAVMEHRFNMAPPYCFK